MGDFGGKFEGKLEPLEQSQYWKLNPEVNSLFGVLFKDDYEVVEETENDKSDIPIDSKAEMKSLFADDYSDDVGTIDSSDDVGQEQERADLTKSYESNSKFEVNGQTYETDDSGYIYKVNGYELLPDNEYAIDGVTYNTDNLGRIISCDGNAKSMPDGERDQKAQSIAGGEDRREGDQGGHILARVLGGAKGIENMLAMRGTAINQSVYKRMENEISKNLEEGKEAHVNVQIEYEGRSQRPSKITVMYTIDGKKTVVQFDNDESSTDLLDSVEDKIDNDVYNDLKQEIQDAKGDGADISVVSVKTVCDENDNVTKVIVTIRDENSDHPVNEDRVFTPKEAA